MYAKDIGSKPPDNVQDIFEWLSTDVGQQWLETPEGQLWNLDTNKSTAEQRATAARIAETFSKPPYQTPSAIGVWLRSGVGRIWNTTENGKSWYKGLLTAKNQAAVSDHNGRFDYNNVTFNVKDADYVLNIEKRYKAIVQMQECRNSGTVRIPKKRVSIRPRVTSRTVKDVFMEMGMNNLNDRDARKTLFDPKDGNRRGMSMNKSNLNSKIKIFSNRGPIRVYNKEGTLIQNDNTRGIEMGPWYCVPRKKPRASKRRYGERWNGPNETCNRARVIVVPLYEAGSFKVYSLAMKAGDTIADMKQVLAKQLGLSSVDPSFIRAWVSKAIADNIEDQLSEILPYWKQTMHYIARQSESVLYKTHYHMQKEHNIGIGHTKKVTDARGVTTSKEKKIHQILAPYRFPLMFLVKVARDNRGNTRYTKALDFIREYVKTCFKQFRGRPRSQVVGLSRKRKNYVDPSTIRVFTATDNDKKMEVSSDISIERAGNLGLLNTGLHFTVDN